jgi:hypothetical protein
MNVSPNAAMLAYIESAVAAPSPMNIPRACPSANVLRMHSTPTGPIGIAIAKPMIKPFKKYIGSIIVSFEMPEILLR